MPKHARMAARLVTVAACLTLAYAGPAAAAPVLPDLVADPPR